MKSDYLFVFWYWDITYSRESRAVYRGDFKYGVYIFSSQGHKKTKQQRNTKQRLYK